MPQKEYSVVRYHFNNGKCFTVLTTEGGWVDDSNEYVGSFGISPGYFTVSPTYVTHLTENPIVLDEGVAIADILSDLLEDYPDLTY